MNGRSMDRDQFREAIRQRQASLAAGITGTPVDSPSYAGTAIKRVAILGLILAGIVFAADYAQDSIKIKLHVDDLDMSNPADIMNVTEASQHDLTSLEVPADVDRNLDLGFFSAFEDGVVEDPPKEEAKEEGQDGFDPKYWNNRPMKELCAEEKLKQDVEARFNNNTAAIWFQHIQRTAGYLMCSYVRSNGVLDLATQIGCGQCPCGHGTVDKKLARSCHQDIKLKNLVGMPKMRNLAHSKDAARAATPTVSKMNLVMVEYSHFHTCPPITGKFVYFTLLRHPVDQFLSWANRFEGAKTNNHWPHALTAYKRGNRRAIPAYLYSKAKEDDLHGGYNMHKAAAITNTFATVSRIKAGLTQDAAAIENLLKFNFVWTYEGIYDQLNATVGKTFGWDQGAQLLEKLSVGTAHGTYSSYKGRSGLPPNLIAMLEKAFAADIKVYEAMQVFNEQRRALQQACKSGRWDYR